jgi:hypothetical protein
MIGADWPVPGLSVPYNPRAMMTGGSVSIRVR